MQEYKLTPAFFSQMRKRIFTFGVPLCGLLAFVGIWVGTKGNISSSSIIIAIPLLGSVLGFGLFSSLRQQQRLWASYRLVVGEHYIKRIQQGMPEITIAKNELSKITEAAGGGLMVQASAPDRQIVIPATIENYSELRSLLSGWHAIQNLSQTRVKWLSFLPVAASLLTIAAYTTTMLATNPVLVVGVGTLLLVVLLASLVLIQRSIYMTRQVKRSSWFIILPMFTLVVRILYAVTDLIYR